MTVDNNLEFEKRANSVKQLCDLYMVVIAISVGLAFNGIVDVARVPLPIKVEEMPLFFAFLITIIPFFHGAVRHLYATYVEGGGSSRVKNWAILIDYYLLFMQGGIFVALATSIGNQGVFHLLFTAVLSVDVAWGVMAAIGFAGTNSQEAEIKWAVINFVTVILLLLLLIFAPALAKIDGMGTRFVTWMLLIIAILRTAVDYWKNINFYCPGPKH